MQYIYIGKDNDPRVLTEKNIYSTIYTYINKYIELKGMRESLKGNVDKNIRAAI